MNLGKDQFTVCYEPNRVSVRDIMTKVRSLGYRPETVLTNTDPSVEKDPSKTKNAELLPELVSSALRRSIEAEKLLLIDFYASWCAPCHKLETDLARPEVKRVLEDFLVLTVDTDEYPKVVSHFNVVAMPTLIVLDSDAKERLRMVGIIAPHDLVRGLSRAAERLHRKASGYR